MTLYESSGDKGSIKRKKNSVLDNAKSQLIFVVVVVARRSNWGSLIGQGNMRQIILIAFETMFLNSLYSIYADNRSNKKKMK